MEDIDVEELKQAAPIAWYVDQFYKDKIPLINKSNNTYFANCIFHTEKTGSLAFFPNGSFHCFGCDAHGDVISLVQHIENVSFQEACKIIGDNVGIDIVLEPPNPYHEQYKTAMDNHNRRYWVNLQNNGEALQYLLNERGLTKESIDTFRLGLTDDNEYQFRTDMGNISHKIVFPILEHKRKNAKCVGMAYRGLTNEKPKYINDVNQEGRENQDPNNAGVFIKGNMLYGLPMAYKGIAERKYLILVEGYLDVISMHQAGFTNTVGAMGTNITDNQIKEMCKITNNVLLFLDGDNAGCNSMMNHIKAFYDNNLNVSVVVTGNGMDPADVCKSFNFDILKIDGFIRENTQNGAMFVINNAVKKYENIVHKERLEALNIAMPILQSIKNPNAAKMYQELLNKRLDL